MGTGNTNFRRVTIPHTTWGDFRRAGDVRVNVFEIDERYLFKQYFESKDVFDRRKAYYIDRKHRFQVPADKFEEIRAFLADHGYGLVTVDAVPEFVVVVEKYSDHPEDLVKNTVIQRTVDGSNCFLLTDQVAVEQAVHNGATRLSETALRKPL